MNACVNYYEILRSKELLQRLARNIFSLIDGSLERIRNC